MNQAITQFEGVMRRYGWGKGVSLPSTYGWECHQLAMPKIFFFETMKLV